MISGIFKLQNGITKKCFFGQSHNITEAFTKLFEQLEDDTHECELLQADYNRYGADSFSFTIEEIIKESRYRQLSCFESITNQDKNYLYNTIADERGPTWSRKRICRYCGTEMDSANFVRFHDRLCPHKPRAKDT